MEITDEPQPTTHCWVIKVFSIVDRETIVKGLQLCYVLKYFAGLMLHVNYTQEIVQTHAGIVGLQFTLTPSN